MLGTSKRLGRRGLVCGRGINDCPDPVYWREGGKQQVCPIYSTWADMLARCYSEKELSRNPSYADTEVCDEWLSFSNFKRWVEAQPWRGNQIDKDILHPGANLYSPETCTFIPKRINVIFKGYNKGRKGLPIGVCESTNPNRKKKYVVYFNKKWAGNFYTPNEAHKLWQELKSKAYSDHYDWYVEQKHFDPRVADRLLEKSWAISLDRMLDRETKEV